MIVEKRMCRIGMRQAVMVFLVVAGIVCLFGHEADARVSPAIYAEHDWLAVSSKSLPVPENPDWIFAQRKRGRGKLPPEVDARVKEWNQMSPEEQERYQQRYQQLQQMSPKERQRYEKLHKQLKRLSPKERQQIRNQLQRPEKLSPKEIDTIRRRFKN